MRSQPRTQQRPKALSGIDMNLMEAVPVLISGVFPLAMTHGVVVKSLFCQPMVDTVFIGMNPGAGGNGPLDQGTNRGLLDVLQHPVHHRPAPLDHPEDRQLFIRQDPTPARALQAPPPPAAFF